MKEIDLTNDVDVADLFNRIYNSEEIEILNEIGASIQLQYQGSETVELEDTSPLVVIK